MCFLVGQQVKVSGIAGKKTTKKLHVKKIEKKMKFLFIFWLGVFFFLFVGAEDREYQVKRPQKKSKKKNEKKNKQIKQRIYI